MLIVPHEIRVSAIHGTSGFLLKAGKKGDLGPFDARLDPVSCRQEIDGLPELARQFVETYICQHQDIGLWRMPGSNARSINHSEDPTLSADLGVFGDYMEVRDLDAGSLLTSDYKNICDKTRTTGAL